MKTNKDNKIAYKYAQIKTDLSVKILEGQLRPHDRIPSLNEITHHYKVSKITARRVLNDLVNEGLVYALRGRGSFVSDLASRPANGGTPVPMQQVGVVFEHAAGVFMSEIIRGIDEEAFRHHVHVNLCLSNDSYVREAEILERLARQGVNKILLFMVLSGDPDALNENVGLYLRLREQGVQILQIACYVPGVPLPFVGWDDYAGYRELIRCFQRKGCRNLVFVSRTTNASSRGDRLRAFKDGLLESKLAYRPEHIVHVPAPSTDRIESEATRAMVEFLRKERKFDAIVCSDEVVAAGVFEAMRQTGGMNPERIRVGGMGSVGNLHMFKGAPYYLLEGDASQLGREAARMMLAPDSPLNRGDAVNSKAYRKLLPLPLKVPRQRK